MRTNVTVTYGDGQELEAKIDKPPEKAKTLAKSLVPDHLSIQKVTVNE